MSPKSAAETETGDLNTEIALFRYGLIAQLVHTPPDKGHQERLLREIAARTYRIPGSTRTHVSVTTLRRYLQAYRDHGFDALRPSPRADAGTPRAFPPEVLEQAIALREEQPARTTQTLVDILQRDEQPALAAPAQCPHPDHAPAPARQDPPPVGPGRRVYRRFERDHVNSLWQGDAMVGPGCPTPTCRARSAAPICSASSTITAAWSPTPNSFSTKRCRAWNACSRSPSCAAACPTPSTWTTARSIRPCSSMPPAPPSASSASKPPPTRPKAKANRNASSKRCGSSSCPKSRPRTSRP